MVKTNRASSLAWGIAGMVAIATIFYFVQVLGMQDWFAPVEFIIDRWYLIAPLVAGFGTQVGLFRAIHLLSRHGGGGTMATSGGVSSGTMLACCLHNLVPLFPVLGASGLAAFFISYQTEVFVFSIGVTALGVWFMIKKYHAVKRACEMPKQDMI